MFDLGNDADLPVVFHGQPTELVDVVLECRHTPQAVVQRVVLPDVRQPLDRDQWSGGGLHKTHARPSTASRSTGAPTSPRRHDRIELGRYLTARRQTLFNLHAYDPRDEARG